MMHLTIPDAVRKASRAVYQKISRYIENSNCANVSHRASLMRFEIKRSNVNIVAYLRFSDERSETGTGNAACLAFVAPLRYSRLIRS